MRFIAKFAVAVVVSLVLFGAMQILGGAHCLDCGAKVGFPLAYMREGTYATHGYMIWSGFVVDSCIALGAGVLSALALWHRLTSLRRGRSHEDKC
jgi:hypothetical protein